MIKKISCTGKINDQEDQSHAQGPQIGNLVQHIVNKRRHVRKTPKGH